MRAKYLLQVHPLVFSEDLPSLSKELQSDFERLFKPILQLSPNDGGILSCHKLKGKLKGYHSLEITYNNQEYRLVYRIQGYFILKMRERVSKPDRQNR